MNLLCPSCFRQYRCISPLLLTLLLTIADAYLGAPSEDVRIMDGGAMIRPDQELATLLEEGDGLVDPNARGTDQRRQITLRQG
jgi:hypothetical protein